MSDVVIVRAAIGRQPVTALVLGLAALGALFHAEATAAVTTWASSTAYSHGFLVLPIALWLAWERRAQISAAGPARPLPVAALLMLPLAGAWLVAERLGIMEGRQLVAIACMIVLFLAVLGPRLCRAMAAPLAYLVFLVPFGAFIEPGLQQFTARFVIAGLNLIGVPNYSDGFMIQIPEGAFYIAEACAGLRFLIASIAFGALYALTVYVSSGRRVLFLLASMTVPVLANGLRALGIIWLGHLLGSAQAAAMDHILYGWVFFSIVTLALAAAGMPFRETAPSPAPAAPLEQLHRSKPPVAAIPAAALAAVFAAAGPAAAMVLDNTTGRAPAVPPTLLTDAGCRAGPEQMMAAMNRRDFACPGGVTVHIATFAPRVTLAPVLATMRGMAASISNDEAQVSTLQVPGGEPATWRLASVTKPDPLAATGAVWVAGEPGGGLHARLRQGMASLGISSLDMSTPGAGAPVAVGITAPDAATLGKFLTANAWLGARLAALGRMSE